MIRENVVVGGLIVLLCAMVGARDRWFLENTKKGQRLVRWFGNDNSIWALRGLIAIGMIFGVLLAAGIIRPMKW